MNNKDKPLSQTISSKKKRILKKTRFEDYEIAYIRQHYKMMTDEEIGDELGRSGKAITRKRTEIGCSKGTGRPKKPLLKGKNQISNSLVRSSNEIKKDIFSQLNREQKKKLFRQRFQNSERHDQLTRILNEDEINFYSERFLDYIMTWDTILTTEEDTLHLAIIELIRGQRILRRQRDAQEEAHGIALEVFDRQYKECVETYNRLMNSLSGTRQQRLSKNSESSISIVTIVQALQDNENRERAGREAAIIQAAKEAAAGAMRAKNYLLD